MQLHIVIIIIIIIIVAYDTHFNQPANSQSLPFKKYHMTKLKQ